jgi:predicted 2-oxoglutarate/Fe(II)-dependent dioxygenase YbiX
MKDSYKILTIPKFVEKVDCDLLINKYNINSELRDAEVYSPNNVEIKKETRKSKVSFVDDIGIMGDRILDKVKEHVGDIKGYEPSLDTFQFTKYEKGDFFDWHADSNDTVFKDRFYTIVLQLNDDYENGDFQLLINKEITLERGVGNLFIFPSEVVHRVKPITSGIRYSLVNWLKLKQIENIKKTLL